LEVSAPPEPLRIHVEIFIQAGTKIKKVGFIYDVENDTPEKIAEEMQRDLNLDPVYSNPIREIIKDSV